MYNVPFKNLGTCWRRGAPGCDVRTLVHTCTNPLQYSKGQLITIHWNVPIQTSGLLKSKEKEGIWQQCGHDWLLLKCCGQEMADGKLENGPPQVDFHQPRQFIPLLRLIPGVNNYKRYNKLVINWLERHKPISNPSKVPMINWSKIGYNGTHIFINICINICKCWLIVFNLI